MAHAETSSTGLSTDVLASYGELAVRVGLNLQQGQRLIISGSLAAGGVPLQAAPLVRAIARSAYRAGAEYVEAIWGDDQLQLIRFEEAQPDNFARFSDWLPDALHRHAEAGHATISISANDPDALAAQPVDLVGQMQRTTARHMHDFRDLITRSALNWCVVAAPEAGWAAKVFPHLPPEEQMAALGASIMRICRLDRDDPIDAWRQHLADLARRRDFLNDRRYDALHYRGPGTDLRLGLPAGHIWAGGQLESRHGIVYTPNLPTEEVFTLPDVRRVDGTVRATKPLAHGSTVIDDFSITFRDGRVVDFTAARGEGMLRQLIESDEGSCRLGEVALVPASSPVGSAGDLFYNTLYDENAACHLALGRAYRFTLEGGDGMDDDEFARAGGNVSAEHSDFMIGSADLDIDGVLADGTVEPLMRSGEWAIPV